MPAIEKGTQIPFLAVMELWMQLQHPGIPGPEGHRVGQSWKRVHRIPDVAPRDWPALVRSALEAMAQLPWSGILGPVQP